MSLDASRPRRYDPSSRRSETCCPRWRKIAYSAQNSEGWPSGSRSVRSTIDATAGATKDRVDRRVFRSAPRISTDRKLELAPLVKFRPPPRCFPQLEDDSNFTLFFIAGYCFPAFCPARSSAGNNESSEPRAAIEGNVETQYSIFYGRGPAAAEACVQSERKRATVRHSAYSNGIRSRHATRRGCGVRSEGAGTTAPRFGSLGSQGPDSSQPRRRRCVDAFISRGPGTA